MCKLVMIDDNQMEHLIMQRMFDGYELFPDASHSLDARLILEFLAKHAKLEALLPDVIFLDLNMPEFSGWDFLTQFEILRPLLKKQIAIYIVSSSIDLDEIARAKAYPFVKDYLSKPIKKETLKRLHLDCEEVHQMTG